MLTPRELRAAHRFIDLVRRRVRAELVQASLFGSRARGTARPDSDVDILLVFRRLSWDREPHATHAEALADRVARETGIPVTAWSVSLPDLDRGERTPMLVDALEDSLPLWCAGAPLPAVPFTPDDALRCMRALASRLEEGGEEFAEHLRHGRPRAAARRARDDLVRGCTAVLLSRGITRPRRGAAVDAFLRLLPVRRIPPTELAVLRWARNSYGPTGQDEEREIAPPPGGLHALARAVHALGEEVRARGEALERALARTHPRA